MAALAADRNLLFGLLALQVGLIDQGQIVAAFQAWTRDKARALADHLGDRGGLDTEQRAGVEAMVALHLRKHGGDVEKSLAAVPANRSTRASLAELGEPEIEATLARVARAKSGHATHADDDNDPDRTAGLSLGAATSDGQRFRLLRPHARGGLGEVFVALDAELHREVALKQILEKHADDPVSRQRFVAEAEITEGLEHPGVVAVYGLGTYSDGRPYYAMRFIRGESLKEAIDRFHGDEGQMGDPGKSSLELRKLLRRFVDVCNAVNYAHSRGVIHRDLKPANIILGRHGETLVVDWGLAKALGRSDPGSGERTLVPSPATGSAETLPGSALGTPTYMSPEQAEGELDRLGPGSDVYSLGATLYCLLTGQPPFAGDDAGAILRVVQQGGFRPPRSLDMTIDPALDAICLKAMALRPEERYPTSKVLAEDIERWMADEPIWAWREPFSRRVRRWTRRNRTAVWTAAAAVLMALAGTVTVLTVQTRANLDLLAANQRTLQERDLARRNFVLAQQNFELARKAVDDYLTRVGQNPLLKEQGLHDLRQELLGDALSYYREFLRQRGDDPSVRTEVAAAQERIGDILIELGRPAEALAAYDQALSLIEPLVHQRPGDPPTATAQVRLQAGRLQALRDGGWFQEAIAAFDRAKGLGETLLEAGGGSADLPEILARTYHNAASVFRNTGRIDHALGAALRAHKLAERATDDRPGDLAVARTRLDVSRLASESLVTKGQADEARRLCEKGIAFGKTQIEKHPRDVEMRMYLATLEFTLSNLEATKGRRLEALKSMRSATDTLGPLVRENPLLTRARWFWAGSLNNLSWLQTDLGQYAEAEQSARRAIDLFEALGREVPSMSIYRMKAGWGYGALGKVRLRAGASGEGLAMLRKAVAILEPSVEPWDLYNQACFLALASTVRDPAEGPTAADRQRRDAERAVARIRRVTEMGFANSDVLENDPDPDSLRSRPDFQALVMDVAFPAEPFAP
jgi:serine/threonine-protein kinase